MNLTMSNHWTGRLPDGRWLKVARDDTATAAREIATELIVAHVLGRSVTPCRYEGRPAFIAPDYGDPVNVHTPTMLTELMRLGEYPAPSGLRPATDLGDIIAERIATRVGSPDLAQHLMARLEAIDIEAVAGDRLQHTDPHCKNWLSGDCGRWTLIDFESARAGDPHLDLGAFLHSCIVAGDESMAEITAACADDRARLRAAFALKTVTSTSWLWRHEHNAGRDADAAARKRLALVDGWTI